MDWARSGRGGALVGRLHQSRSAAGDDVASHRGQCRGASVWSLRIRTFPACARAEPKMVTRYRSRRVGFRRVRSLTTSHRLRTEFTSIFVTRVLVGQPDLTGHRHDALAGSGTRFQSILSSTLMSRASVGFVILNCSNVRSWCRGPHRVVGKVETTFQVTSAVTPCSVMSPTSWNPACPVVGNGPAGSPTTFLGTNRASGISPFRASGSGRSRRASADCSSAS